MAAVTRIWNGSEFVEIQGVVGPEGPQGADGADGATGADGPQGSPGPTAISTDPGNQSVLGSDTLLFTPDFATGVYLPLSGGILTGGLEIRAGLNVDDNLHVGIAGIEQFRVIRNNRGLAGEYAQFWAGAGAQGLSTSGAIVRYHDGTVTAGDYYHGSQQPGGRGLHNPPGASIAVGSVFQTFFTDGARNFKFRKVSSTSLELAILDNVGAHNGGLVMTSDGDTKVGVTPRSGSQLRNFAHSSTDAPPSGTQPGDVFLVYT